jgi:hypothetical protein
LVDIFRLEEQLIGSWRGDETSFSPDEEIKSQLVFGVAQDLAYGRL